MSDTAVPNDELLADLEEAMRDVVDPELGINVVEYLQGIRSQLPDGVNPVIGPDATGVGWVFEYALVDDSGRHTLADLRGNLLGKHGRGFDELAAADTRLAQQRMFHGWIADVDDRHPGFEQ